MSDASGDPSPDEPGLNPAQQEVLDLLGAAPEDRPTFAPTLRATLRAELDDALADLADVLDPADPLRVSKHDLAMVHGCELRHLTDRSKAFEWSPPIARGSVAHKAIELSLHRRGRPVALDLVDEAIDRLERSDESVGVWLATCTESERAEVRAAANERVATFLECFPPLRAAWSPVTESRMRLDLLGGRVVISGRSDLTLGRADGHTAGKVIIDFKTGAPTTTHLDDLRLYALLEAVRIGTPPRLMASYYLDSATTQAEVVTEGVLHSAVVRTTDGIRKIHELATRTRPPVIRPGWGCRWCAALPDCGDGRAHLGRLDDDSDRFDDD